MTSLGLRPYPISDDPSPHSVPVGVVVLTLNEESNNGRCLASVEWAEQVVALDSGSVDDTIMTAHTLDAAVSRRPQKLADR